MHRLPLPLASTIRSLALLALTSGCSFGIYDPDHPYTADTGVLDSEPDADTDTDADADSDADSDSDSDTDSDADADTLRVTSVTPSYGTTAGNAQVVITGGPFDSSASVRFGGSAATVDSVTSTEIHVHTPSASAEGTVDVLVSTSASSGTLTSGFYYIEDAAGRTGVIGTLAWSHYVGDSWDASVHDDGYAWYVYTVPTNLTYAKMYSTSMDTCTSGYSPSGDLYIYDFGVATATWNSSSGAGLNFGWDSSYGEYSMASVTNTQFVQGDRYDQATLSGTEFPAFSMPNISRTPSSFTVNSPNLSASNPPFVSKSAFTLSWSGAGSGDLIVADILLLSADTSTVVEEVSCSLTDDGSFNVPSSVWHSWANNRYLIVSVGRATLGTGTVPYNNGNSEVAGVYNVVGVAQTQ